ncbi:RpoD family RNA polymerase sigma factor [Calothrix sp. NIES-4071]|nr:RpoD family RNA polymerase sigma factor [Calothrix sp. NIES-4071]BAZ54746.1 RpoD family RNA polymerase sigma factor [Calothrix sp. NIES-4105]
MKYSTSNTTANKRKEQSQRNADLVRNYLSEIGKIPLLTHEQEIINARQVQEMMVIFATQKNMTVQLKRPPTHEELANEVQLSTEILLKKLNQGQQAKQTLILANLRLVVKIAKQYQKHNLEFLDLIQEGTLGLQRGVEKFDPTLGFKFSTYAYWWIRQGIIRALTQKGYIIRLPVHVTEIITKVKRAQRELSQKNGRTPTTDEIADVLSIQPDKIRDCLLLSRQPVSLDMRVGVEKETSLKDTIEDTKTTSSENVLIQESTSQEIQDLLSSLSPQQQEILTLRFGLIDEKKLSYAEIGRRLGLSRERIRQIEKKSLAILRHQYKLD